MQLQFSNMTTPAPEPPAGRVSLTKRQRFEIFKRDGFRCQYCGRRAPDVALEVDHIDPVANGGENEDGNLITACKDCNRGKSDKLLTDQQAREAMRGDLLPALPPAGDIGPYRLSEIVDAVTVALTALRYARTNKRDR